MSSMRIYSMVMAPEGTHCAVEWKEEGSPRSVVESKRLVEKVAVGEECSVRVMERSKPVVYKAKLLGYGSKREMTAMLEREELEADSEVDAGDADEDQLEEIDRLIEEADKENDFEEEFAPKKKRGRKPRSSNKQPSAKKLAERNRQAEADRVTARLLEGLPAEKTPEPQLPPMHQSTPCVSNPLRDIQHVETPVRELPREQPREIEQQHSVDEAPDNVAQAAAGSRDLFDSDDDCPPPKRPRLEYTPRNSFQIAGNCGDVQPYVLIAELKELMYSQFGELNRKIDKLNDSFIELKTLISKKKPKQHQQRTQQSGNCSTITPAGDEVEELQEDTTEDPLTVCCGNQAVPGKHIFLTVATEAALVDFKQISSCPAKDPAKFALKLLSVFFTDKELSESNCTKADGRKLLDANILLGIRHHTNFKYPVTSAEEAKRWQNIVIKNLNTKCRATRRKLNLKSAAGSQEQES